MSYRRKSRKAKRPPGQRLIGYLALAVVATIFQPQCLPLGPINASDVDGKVSLAEPFKLDQELLSSEAQLNTMCAIPALQTGVFAIDPLSGRYIEFNGKKSYSAASMIKLPILVSLLTAVDRGELNMDQKLKITPNLVTGGSGYLQWRRPGTAVTVHEAAELMIVISDNTATNLLINALGGKQRLNAEFVKWGMTKTVIHNLLADFEGTNKTSPYDLVYLLGRVERGELLSEASRKWMFDVLARTRTKTLLPQGLEPGSHIAHKTGDIGCMVGDAGSVTTADGMHYLVAVQVQRPHNDRRANELIRNISKVIYRAYSQAATAEQKNPALYN